MSAICRFAVVLIASSLVFGIGRSDGATTAADGSISGSVSGGKGQAVSVKLYKVRHGKSGSATTSTAKRRHRSAQLVREASTDANGNFTMGDVPAGEYMVVAELKSAGSAHSSVSVTAGQTSTVSLTLAVHHRTKRVKTVQVSQSTDPELELPSASCSGA